MSKMNWDKRSAQDKQRKLIEHTTHTKEQIIAQMVETCIVTMKRKGQDKTLTEAEMLQKATKWALKKYEENLWHRECRKKGAQLEAEIKNSPKKKSWDDLGLGGDL